MIRPQKKFTNRLIDQWYGGHPPLTGFFSHKAIWTTDIHTEDEVVGELVQSVSPVLCWICIAWNSMEN